MVEKEYVYTKSKSVYTSLPNYLIAQLARARDLYSRGRWFEYDKRLKREKR